MDIVTEKQHVHELIERLPPAQLSAVAGLLEAFLDPAIHSLRDAPFEDEQVSEEEERAVAESREWRKSNPPIANEVVLAEFGLTPEDFERMGRTPRA
jgi:hypothetical protein